MKYTPVPDHTAIALVRSLGLLVQQAGMYGLSHNVTQLALREAFLHLESAIAMYGPIEIAFSENTLFVNGAPIKSNDTSLKNFVNRIEMHKIGGVLFSPQIDTEEFLIFTKLLSTSAMTLASRGGIKGAIEGAGLHAITLVNSEYRKVVEEEAEKENLPSSAPIPPPAPATEKAFSLDRGSGPAVLDLSDISAADSPFGFSQPEAEPSPISERDENRMRRQENISKMAAMLRSTAALIENEGMLPGETGQQQILASLERILKMVEASSRATKIRISKLAGQVEADRQTIASIESAARRRGIGFNLTRKELLEHYAEINQEMLQPVTVSSGALDLLLSGKSGPMSESQKELIKLAFEGMGRVNQLIEYMNRISGLPETLTPDQGLVRDSYSC